MAATGTIGGLLRQAFTVPVTSGNYATETLLVPPQDDGGAFRRVSQLRIVLENLITGTAVEVDLLKPGGDPTVAGDWLTAQVSYTVVGLQALLELAGWYGVRIRAKSGGTAGTQNVSLAWI